MDKMIWLQAPDIAEINQLMQNSFSGLLEMEIIDFDHNSLTGVMPVQEKVLQPYGLLHGGVSCAFSETLGSIAGNLCLGNDKHAVGLEINANHIKSVFCGDQLTGIAKNIHLGRITQIWSIKIYNKDHQLCCISRLTLSNIKKRNPSA